jgi:hypothetical protein
MLQLFMDALITAIHILSMDAAAIHGCTDYCNPLAKSHLVLELGPGCLGLNFSIQNPLPLKDVR